MHASVHAAIWFFLIAAATAAEPVATAETAVDPAATVLRVARGADATIDGVADEAVWTTTDAAVITALGGGAGPTTTVRAFTSATTLYLFYECADTRINSTGLPDYAQLYREDVVEAFLQPDPSHPVYFEYEASPLGSQLPVLALNSASGLSIWRRWSDEALTTRVATTARGGERAAGAVISGWAAEVAIPYEAMAGLTNLPPAPGARWRANFFRLEYEGGLTCMSWNPLPNPKMHEPNLFGTLLFD